MTRGTFKMESFKIFIIICPILVICNGEPLNNPVRLSALKSEFDELQECLENKEASFDLFSTVSVRLKTDQSGNYIDITGGTIDLTKIDDETETIKGTLLRYKKNNFYIGEKYKTQLKDFENYKITNSNSRALNTEANIIHSIGTEEFDRSVQDAISKINVDSEKVPVLNIYKIDLTFAFSRKQYINAYYNKDTNSVIITSPTKILISDLIPLPKAILPNPVIKHCLVYDVKSKTFKDGYGFLNSEMLPTIPVAKLRPYPFCEEGQQSVSKFWDKDRSLKISNVLLNNHAVTAINMGGASLIKFDENIQLTLKCNRKGTTCNLHGNFTIDGEDVQDVTSDKSKTFSYKSSRFGNQKVLLQSREVILHPINQKEINNISNMKTDHIIEYVRITELKQTLLRAYDYFEAACRNRQPDFSLHYINYRSVDMEYECESGYFYMVKKPGLNVALYNENTLTETLNINDLEYTIRYNPQSDVFAARRIVSGIYGFSQRDRGSTAMEFRATDVASDLDELGLFFEKIKDSKTLSKSARYSTFAAMRIGTDDIFVAQLNSGQDVSRRFECTKEGFTLHPVMQVRGNFALKLKNGDVETFEEFYHDGKGYLSTDKYGYITKILYYEETEYMKDTRPIRIRFAKESLLSAKREIKIKKEIFYARLSDLREIVKYIKLKFDRDFCKNDLAGIYNVDIKMRNNRDIIVEGKYSCPFGYFSIEIKPYTKVFTKDGKAVVLPEVVKVGFMFDFVSISTRPYDYMFSDIYAFRVKEYSEEHTQTVYQPGDKKDICTDRIDDIQYACYVKRDDSFSPTTG